MLFYRPTLKFFQSRKEAKDYLGGTNKYNRAFKDGDICFMNEMNIANNGSVHCNYKGYYYDRR